MDTWRWSAEVESSGTARNPRPLQRPPVDTRNASYMVKTTERPALHQPDTPLQPQVSTAKPAHASARASDHATWTSGYSYTPGLDVPQCSAEARKVGRGSPAAPRPPWSPPVGGRALTGHRCRLGRGLERCGMLSVRGRASGHCDGPLEAPAAAPFSRLVRFRRWVLHWPPCRRRHWGATNLPDEPALW
jgi:hypothetical protein